jgi:hypothetical protein
MVPICNHGTWKAEAEGLRNQGQYELQVRPYIKYMYKGVIYVVGYFQMD